MIRASCSCGVCPSAGGCHCAASQAAVTADLAHQHCLLRSPAAELELPPGTRLAVSWSADSSRVAVTVQARAKRALRVYDAQAEPCLAASPLATAAGPAACSWSSAPSPGSPSPTSTWLAMPTTRSSWSEAPTAASLPGCRWRSFTALSPHAADQAPRADSSAWPGCQALASWRASSSTQSSSPCLSATSP